MRLTNFTDYSLRVLMYVAVQPDGRATIAEIATAFGISESHLTKVVHHLGKRRLLTNVRGHGGGVQLACPAADINLGAIVRATEAEAALVECFNPTTNRCVITPVCGLRNALAQAILLLLAHPELAARLGRSGHRLVRERFSMDVMVQATERLYDSLLEKRRRIPLVRPKAACV